MPTTIVLADDHTIVRAGIRRLLETREDLVVVGEAANGLQAIDLVLEKKPDLILIDIQMPRLSGVDATRSIVKSGAPTRVIVLSVHQSGSAVEEVLRAGASGYLVKTGEPSELLEAIDIVQGGGRYLSPSISEAVATPGETPTSGLGSLTSREREVLQLIAEGMSSREIAEVLQVSLKTVDSHRSNLMEKLDIHKVSGLVRFAVREGLVEP